MRCEFLTLRTYVKHVPVRAAISLFHFEQYTRYVRHLFFTSVSALERTEAKKGLEARIDSPRQCKREDNCGNPPLKSFSRYCWHGCDRYEGRKLHCLSCCVCVCRLRPPRSLVIFWLPLCIKHRLWTAHPCLIKLFASRSCSFGWPLLHSLVLGQLLRRWWQRSINGIFIDDKTRTG